MKGLAEQVSRTAVRGDSPGQARVGRGFASKLHWETSYEDLDRRHLTPVFRQDRLQFDTPRAGDDHVTLATQTASSSVTKQCLRLTSLI